MKSEKSTVFSNNLNKMKLYKLTSTELRIFFAILNKAKDQKDKTISIPFKDIKKMSNISYHSNARFIKDLKNTYEKLLNLSYVNIKDTKDYNLYESISVFSKFTIMYDKKQSINSNVTIKISEDFIPFINGLLNQFTVLSLKDLGLLSSIYSQLIYIHIIQFKSTNFWKVSIEDFRKILNIPKSYRMSDINSRILKPFIKESVNFKEIKDVFINKYYDKNKGNKITYITFSFQDK